MGIIVCFKLYEVRDHTCLVSNCPVLVQCLAHSMAPWIFCKKNGHVLHLQTILPFYCLAMNLWIFHLKGCLKSLLYSVAPLCIFLMVVTFCSKSSSFMLSLAFHAFLLFQLSSRGLTFLNQNLFPDLEMWQLIVVFHFDYCIYISEKICPKSKAYPLTSNNYISLWCL